MADLRLLPAGAAWHTAVLSRTVEGNRLNLASITFSEHVTIDDVLAVAAARATQEGKPELAARIQAVRDGQL